jgi:hypothetical protein
MRDLRLAEHGFALLPCATIFVSFVDAGYLLLGGDARPRRQSAHRRSAAQVLVENSWVRNRTPVRGLYLCGAGGTPARRRHEHRRAQRGARDADELQARHTRPSRRTIP